MRIELEPIAQANMLRLLLQERKQLGDEQTNFYTNKIESLCLKIDPKMPRSEII